MQDPHAPFSPARRSLMQAAVAALALLLADRPKAAARVPPGPSAPT